MSEQTTSLLQQRLNKRSEDRLKREVRSAIECINNMAHRVSSDRRTITIAKGREWSTKDDGSLTVSVWVFLDELEAHLNANLLERYIGEDTAAFLEQVDRVAELASEQ